MLLVDLVATTDAVGATSKRTEKVELLADLLRRVDPDEMAVVVGLAGGQPRQGKLGVGWATISAVSVGAPATEAAVTVRELDDTLTRLAGSAGPGSAGVRAAALGSLFERMTPAEADFVRRLLVGELRQGALAALVADAVAKATGIPVAVVRRATMLSGDLAVVAATARDGGLDALEQIGLTVLQPVQPMLAGSATDVAAAIEATGRSSVEWKLDGIRVQVHRDGGDVRVFTRNLNDITARLPGIVTLARSFAAERFVLDGEAIGLGGDDRPELFQDTMSRAARLDGEAAAGLVPRFFDLLHLNGRDLLDEPLHERRRALVGLVGTLAVPAVDTDDAERASSMLAESLATGHEGVVIKALSSTYEAGRRGKNWRKVKPVETLDLVVLAAEWGHGRRRGMLSNLHLGARNESGDTGFVMVGKTFKGLTDALLAWQTEHLLAIETERSSYVVHVRPELVVELALDGVQRSSRYPGGVALRFARVRRYREDKDAAEADTIDTVRALL